MKSELESIPRRQSSQRSPHGRRSAASSTHSSEANAELPASPVTKCEPAARSGMLTQLKWGDVFNEAECILRRLIQFETVNPPGNERPAANYLADLLQKEGLMVTWTWSALTEPTGVTHPLPPI
jgi:hypothetical protein